MIRNIINMLDTLEAYNESEEIEIAKGKYKIPRTFKEVFQYIKREFKFKK